MPKRVFIASLFLIGIIIFLFPPMKKDGASNEANPIEKKANDISILPNSPITVKAEEQSNEPKKLVISKINLNAEILAQGLNEKNLMAIPEGNNSLGWWMYGSKIGENGRMILAGHFTQEDGSAGVFFNLNKLKREDTVEVQGGSISQRFRVNNIEYYDTTKFPTTEIYSPDPIKNDLVLITCAGDFSNGDFNRRLVIYAEKI